MPLLPPPDETPLVPLPDDPDQLEGERARRQLAESRFRLAGDLLERNELQAATEEFVWLWQHLAEDVPSMAGVRVSFMAGTMKELASRHPPAKEQFTRLRDALAGRVIGEEPEVDALDDWLTLNRVIEEERSVEWFDGLRSPGEAKPGVLHSIELWVVPLLLERRRWADVGRFYLDPVTTLRERYEWMERLDERQSGKERREEMRAYFLRRFLAQTGELHAALRAARREEEARAVAAEARRLVPGEALEAALRQAIEQAEADQAGSPAG
jgi:hypothetical protein